MIRTLLFFVLTGLNSIAIAQTNTINEAGKAEAVNSIINLMNNNYIYPEKAKEMENYLLLRLKNKGYTDVHDIYRFAADITRDLVFISKDKHIRVAVDPELVKQLKSGGMESALFKQTVKEQHLHNNYYFTEVKVLPGNIGYLNLKGFAQPDDIAEKKVAAVMNLLMHTEAIIIDLRENGGGSPEMVRLITSYFFDEQPVHLNSLYFSRNNVTIDFWTLKDIEGKRMPDKPLYILTSEYTFSGAEEFSYNLKNLNRATLVGESTGGGAHPGDMMVVSDDLVIFVPMGKAINPISNSNWEGTGVEPDLKIDAAKALDLAYFTALFELKSFVKNEKQAHELNWLIPEVESKLNPIKLSADQLENYTGTYEDVEILEVNNDLFIKIGRNKYLLRPLNKNSFEVDKMKDMRVNFNRYYDRKISEIIIIYMDGRRIVKKKN